MVIALPTIALLALTVQTPAPGTSRELGEAFPLFPSGRWRIDTFVSEPTETNRAVISVAPP